MHTFGPERDLQIYSLSQRQIFCLRSATALPTSDFIFPFSLHFRVSPNYLILRASSFELRGQNLRKTSQNLKFKNSQNFERFPTL